MKPVRIRIEIVFACDDTDNPADLLSVVDGMLDGGVFQDAVLDEAQAIGLTRGTGHSVRAEAWDATGLPCEHGYGAFTCPDRLCVNRPCPDEEGL